MNQSKSAANEFGIIFQWENDIKHPTWHYMATYRVVEYSEILHTF